MEWVVWNTGVYDDVEKSLRLMLDDPKLRSKAKRDTGPPTVSVPVTVGGPHTRTLGPTPPGLTPDVLTSRMTPSVPWTRSHSARGRDKGDPGTRHSRRRCG